MTDLLRILETECAQLRHDGHLHVTAGLLGIIVDHQRRSIH
ncbi:hypothetical protein [Nocardia tengchongensis]